MTGSDKKEQKLASNEFASGGAAPLLVQDPDVSAFVIKDDPLGLIPRAKLDTDQKTTIATWDGSLPTNPARTEYFRLQVARAGSNEWTLLQEHPYVGRANLLTQVNANGVTETSEWYDKAGEQDEQGHWLCPADPQGFVRNLKSKTVTPAQSKYGKAPTLETSYRYTAELGLANAGPWLAMADETLMQVGIGQAKTLQVAAYKYINEPNNPLEHGRKLQDTVTLDGNPLTYRRALRRFSYRFRCSTKRS
ncbi:hypothetical protein [Pseudomonas fluorescens]|nr:hypothetical protein [Pseudomonas fluorescens]